MFNIFRKNKKYPDEALKSQLECTKELLDRIHWEDKPIITTTNPDYNNQR